MKSIINQRKIFALSQNGKRCSFEISSKERLGFLNECQSNLVKEGFTGEELKNVIFSHKKLEEFPKVDVVPERAKVLNAEEVASDSNLPPIPQPQNKNSKPPQQSDSILVSSNGADIFIEIFGNEPPSSGFIPLPAQKALNPQFPSPVSLAYKRYWLNTFTEIIKGPQNFSHTVSTTKGMSSSNTTTLSAELGVAVDGLSAKLSATTSHTITISNSTTVTNTCKVDVPSGKTCVFTYWQLIDEFVLLGNDGNPVTWSGKYLNLGELGWIFPAKFPQNLFSNNTNTYASSPVFFNN